MASSELPKFDDQKTYVLKGSTLNLIIAAIRAAQIVSVDGMDIARTPEGIVLTRKQ